MVGCDTHTDLANRRFRPLSHLSESCFCRSVLAFASSNYFCPQGLTTVYTTAIMNIRSLIASAECKPAGRDIT